MASNCSRAINSSISKYGLQSTPLVTKRVELMKMANNIHLSLSIFLMAMLISHQCYEIHGFSPFAEFLRKFRGVQSDAFGAFSSLGSESDTSAKALPVFVSPQDGLKENDKIERLPGQPDHGVDFNQYSGYVKVDSQRALFYYFVESPKNSYSKPLLLWFNGVPGCSSFGIGAWTEIGPFRVHKDGKSLYLNQYAWNSGETYAGHFATQLAQLIIHQNKYSNYAGVINLKGIALGNSYIDYESSYYGSWDYSWTHALISDEIYKGIYSSCNISSTIISDKCNEYLDLGINVTENINPYDIYAPLCNSTPGASPYSYVGPCSTDYVLEYIDNQVVQIALHANVDTIPYPWSICNGDTDSDIPVTSAQFAVNKLKLSVRTPWHPWYLENEVAGYVVEYQNLTFVTVRGAGHFVPYYQPARALALFSSFINGKLPPSN
ncbi:hypothetical protein ACH5RR_027251 [Cinchona calisaya]|uniref:Serine carboxypeptidase n=1 Tax=Cinchona calisaya TaxID=153742 RepID=A0ABD2Z623_9GENT